MLQLVQRAAAGDALTPQDVDLAIRLSAGGDRGLKLLALRVLKARPSSDEAAWSALQRLVCGAVQSPEESDLAVAALHTLNALPEERLLWTCRQENIVEALKTCLEHQESVAAADVRRAAVRACGRAYLRLWMVLQGTGVRTVPFESQTEGGEERQNAQDRAWEVRSGWWAGGEDECSVRGCLGCGEGRVWGRSVWGSL